MVKSSGLSDSDRIKLLYIISLITILGNTLDFFSANLSDFIRLVNSTTILIVIVFVSATRFFKLRIIYSFWAVIYSLILNIIVSHLSNLHFNSDLSILRSILILTVLIPASAFLINRIHAIAIGLITLMFLYFFTYFAKSPFSIHNVSILTLLILGFSIGMYYLMFLLEESSILESPLITLIFQKVE